jgi:molybdopterin converting factor small subunit
MSIKLLVDGSVLDYKREKEVMVVNGNTVGDCVNYLVQKQDSLKKLIFDENGNILMGNQISLNSQIIYPVDLAKAVKDGDEIVIFKFRGGC